MEHLDKERSTEIIDRHRKKGTIRQKEGGRRWAERQQNREHIAEEGEMSREEEERDHGCSPEMQPEGGGGSFNTWMQPHFPKPSSRPNDRYLATRPSEAIYYRCSNTCVSFTCVARPCPKMPPSHSPECPWRNTVQ